jgi:hypothetical protein
MYSYWRINEELKYMGEVIVFHDPSLKRCYMEWVRRKADVLSMLEMEEEKETSPVLQFLLSFQNMN